MKSKAAFMKGMFFVLSSVVAIHVPAQENKNNKPKSEQTHEGKVFGRVYDAITGKPIEKASVRAYTRNGFLESGKSNTNTDAIGGYQLSLVIGRSSSSVDVGRFLFHSLPGLLLGGANTKDRQIDVSKVPMIVTAPGYKTFEGSVESKLHNPGAFRIDLAPVLLMPESQAGASISQFNWTPFKFTNSTVSAPVAIKGQTLNFQTQIPMVNAEIAAKTEVVVYSEIWKNGLRLNPSGSINSKGLQTYEANYNVTGKERYKALRIQFGIRKSPLDFTVEKASPSFFVMTGETAPPAEAVEGRRKALEAFEAGNYEEAYKQIEPLMSVKNAELFDSRLAGIAYLKEGKFNKAHSALIHQVRFDRFVKEYRQAYYESLFRAGSLYELKSYSDDDVELDVEGVRNESSPEMLSYLGLTHLRFEETGRANRFGFRINGLNSNGFSPIVREFRAKLQIARFLDKEIQKKENVTEMQHVYGLLELKLFADATKILNRMKGEGAKEVGIARDLAWIEANTNLANAPVSLLKEGVEDGLSVTNTKNKEKNQLFSEMYRTAMLQTLIAEKGDDKEDRLKAIELLRSCLPRGRNPIVEQGGDFFLDVAIGMPFFLVDQSQVAASGFVCPEANGAFMLSESLERLMVQPNDHVALLNAAIAYHNLGFSDLANRYLSKVEEIRPDYLDSKVLRIQMESLKGSANSKELLKQLKEIAPNHPKVAEFEKLTSAS